MKPTRLPALQRVAISSSGHLEEVEGDEEGHGSWAPPSYIAQAFDRASIALSVNL